MYIKATGRPGFKSFLTAFPPPRPLHNVELCRTVKYLHALDFSNPKI
jgi:hypothetical protein